MQEFTLGPLNESRSAPDGRQFVGQAANLNFESVCRLPQIKQTNRCTNKTLRNTKTWETYSLL